MVIFHINNRVPEDEITFRFFSRTQMYTTSKQLLVKLGFTVAKPKFELANTLIMIII